MNFINMLYFIKHQPLKYDENIDKGTVTVILKLTSGYNLIERTSDQINGF